ncbi:MAG TPA: glycosyltransferase [Pyrinomonadaceae bacterium]|nr:glycosyltransferase [Pyrinomonadaceae bacterium]
MEAKRIVLNTFGSYGDIHPYLALGMELRARGHSVVVATMEIYHEKVRNAGLEFAAVRPNIPQPKDQEPGLIDKIMDPKNGPRFLTEEVIFPAVRDSYQDLVQAVNGADLLVTHPAAPAGPLVGRKTGMRWISTVLAPLSFFSAYDPPVPPYWQWTSKLQLLGPRVMKPFLDFMKNNYKAKAVVDFRSEIGLSDNGNPMFDAQHSPELVLAMFSRSFASPQPDWPPQTRITGFCFYDGNNEEVIPSDLLSFLEAGPAPIVFTLGSSAVWVARDFFRESIKAAQSLGQRAVLIIGDERNSPAEIPEGMIAINYAPYQALLPKASVVVHHGGVGTTAQGLLAGVPTLIVPFAFDQSDNAAHAKRIGTSRTVYRSKYFAPRVARELKELLTDKSYVENARSVSGRLKVEDGPGTASDLIEELLTKSRLPEEEMAYAPGN